MKLAEAVAIELDRAALTVLEGGRSSNFATERDAAFCRAATRAGWPRRFTDPGRIARFVERIVTQPEAAEVVSQSLIERWALATGDDDPLATCARVLHDHVTQTGETRRDRYVSLRALKLITDLLLPKDHERAREMMLAAWNRGVAPGLEAEHRAEWEARHREFALYFFSSGWDAALSEGEEQAATSVA